MFDPSSAIFKLNLLYRIFFLLFLLIPIKKITRIVKQIPITLIEKIKQEIKFILPRKKGNVAVTITLFTLILTINVLALFPQNFPNTPQLTLNLLLAIVLWIRTLLFGITKNTKSFLIHLVPQGTPSFLINFMVLIEITRILIRPITLSVRLTANILAGHLLMSLLRNFLMRRNFFLSIFYIPFVLTILERAVAFIQAYVFVTLITLYAAENQYAKKISSIPHSRKKTLAFNRLYLSPLFNIIYNFMNK